MLHFDVQWQSKAQKRRRENGRGERSSGGNSGANDFFERWTLAGSVGRTREEGRGGGGGVLETILSGRASHHRRRKGGRHTLKNGRIAIATVNGCRSGRIYALCLQAEQLNSWPICSRRPCAVVTQ